MSSRSWEHFNLGDLCTITSSKRIFAEEYVDSGIPFYRSKEIIEKAMGESITECLFISKERFREVKKQFGAPRKGDLLLSSVGNRSGIPYIVNADDGDFYFKDGNLIWFKDYDSKLSGHYLFYWLNSVAGQNSLNSIMIGSAQKALTIVGLSGLEIPLPPLPIQANVVSILSSLDEKMELNRQTNATLETIIQTIFKEWFVDYRFPGETGEIQDSALGPIPVGWIVKKLGDALTVKGGTTPGTSVSEYWGGENHWATPKDLSNLKSPVLLETERKITDKGLKQIGSGLLPKGTLLLSSRAPIGYLAISQIPIAVNQGFIAINGLFVSNLYMLFWLKTNMDSIKERANGSTFMEISKSNFKDIGMVLPSKTLLDHFDFVVTPLFEQIISNEIEARTLFSVRNFLLLKLMTGEIEV